MKLWWLSPARLTLFMLLPIYVLCGMLGADAYMFYNNNTQYFTGDAFYTGLMAMFAIIIAGGVGEYLGLRRPENQALVDAAALGRCLYVLFGLTFVGYALLITPYLLNPGMIKQLWAGSVTVQADIRESFVNSGVKGTTLMGLQVLVVSLAFGWQRLCGQPLPRIFRRLFWLLVGLCLFRAWFWSERLAVLELVIPLGLLIAFQRPSRSRLFTFAPLIGAVGVYLLFSLGEYFRSWQHMQVYGLGFWEYTLDLISGYYATALNNGAAFYEVHGAFYRPALTAVWAYSAPVPGTMIGGRDAVFGSFSWFDFLSIYTNPGFNNGSGLFAPLIDYGAYLGIAVWAVVGAFNGWLAAIFARRSLFGMVLYPAWFIGVVEVLRVFYWSDYRFFMPMVASVLVTWYLARHRVAPPPSDAPENGTPSPASSTPLRTPDAIRTLP